MDVGGASLAGAVVGFVVAGASAAAVHWAGPVDAPRSRGAHSKPTVTSGGLSILAGTSLGLIAFALAAGPVHGLAPAALALGFAGVLGLMGALDDLLDLGAKPKLALQVLIALAFAVMVRRIDVLPLGFGIALPLGLVAGSIGTALWLVVTTNAVNFMDGANGLCVGSMAIALAALGAAGLAQGEPAVAGVAFAGAAAHLGFLPWNLPMRRMFQGDAGSLFSGFLAASLAVLAAGHVTLYLMPFALTPFLTDVLLTLLIRARRGQSLFQAHSDHLFQLWLRSTGKSHAALALRVWSIVGLYALAGLGAEAAPSGWRPVLFALGVVAASVGWRVIRKRLERRAAQ